MRLRRTSSSSGRGRWAPGRPSALAGRAGRTTLIDAFGAGHPRSTSGDETRILRAAHGADTFYTRWSREARTAWQAFEAEVGERFYVEAGMLWFAHREDGFEAHSIAALTSLGIPVRRLSPTDLADGWPQIAADDLAFAAYEPEAGLLLARNGVAAVARTFARDGGRFELAWVEPGATDGRRLLDVVGGDGTRYPGGTFVFAAGPWLPRLFPDVAGELIRVTKQDVMFFGPPAGDGRFNAEWLPCWVDYDAATYGMPAVAGRGMKLAPDRYGPVFDPTNGERQVDPESVRLARRYMARTVPGDGRRAGRRDPGVPVRDDARHRFRDRSPSRVRQRLAGRRRLGPRLQARSGDRELRGVAHRRRPGRRR